MRRLRSLIVLGLGTALAFPAALHGQGGDTLRLRLADALSAGGERHPAILRARSDTRVRSAQAYAGHAAWLPRIGVELDVLRGDDPVFAFGSRLRQGRFGQADFALGALNRPLPLTDAASRLTVEQPVFRPADLLARRAGLAAARAASQAERRTAEMAAFEVVRGYFGLVLTGQRVQVLGEALDLSRRIESQVQSLRRSGTVTIVDEQLARARTAELVAALAGAEAGREAASDRLLLLLGQPGGRAVIPSDSLTPPGTPSDSGAAPERSDVAAFREALAAADAGVARARASWLPSAGAFGTLEWHDGSIRPIGGPEHWTAGVVLRWTPFQGLADVGGLRQSEAERDAARERLAEAVRQADADVRSARADRHAAELALAAAEGALAGAAEASRVAQVRYGEGLSTITELLAVRAAESTQRLARLDALYQLRVASAALDLAQGRAPR